MSARVVGVDVGGTFTDLFLFDAAAGRYRVAKVPSQRGDEASGFLEGLQALDLDEESSAPATVVHGTTVALNALLTLFTRLSDPAEDPLEMDDASSLPTSADSDIDTDTPLAPSAANDELTDSGAGSGSRHGPEDALVLVDAEEATFLTSLSLEGGPFCFFHSSCIMSTNSLSPRCFAKSMAFPW